MGWTEGGTIWQTVGGQIGGTSIELEQIGVIFPLTHLQTQLPEEFDEIRIESSNRYFFMYSSG